MRLFEHATRVERLGEVQLLQEAPFVRLGRVGHLEMGCLVGCLGTIIIDLGSRIRLRPWHALAESCYYTSAQ